MVDWRADFLKLVTVVISVVLILGMSGYGTSACPFCSTEATPFGVTLIVGNGKDSESREMAEALAERLNGLATDKLKTGEPVSIAYVKNPGPGEDVQSAMNALGDYGYSAALGLPLFISSYSLPVHELAVDFGAITCEYPAHNHGQDGFEIWVPNVLTAAIDFSPEIAGYYRSRLMELPVHPAKDALIFVFDIAIEPQMEDPNHEIFEQYVAFFKESNIEFAATAMIYYDELHGGLETSELQEALQSNTARGLRSIIIPHSIMYPGSLQAGIGQAVRLSGVGEKDYEVLGNGLSRETCFFDWVMAQMLNTRYLPFDN